MPEDVLLFSVVFRRGEYSCLTCRREWEGALLDTNVETIGAEVVVCFPATVSVDKPDDI